MPVAAAKKSAMEAVVSNFCLFLQFVALVIVMKYFVSASEYYWISLAEIKDEHREELEKLERRHREELEKLKRSRR